MVWNLSILPHLWSKHHMVYSSLCLALWFHPPHCSQNILTKRQGVCILRVHLERVTAWHAQTSLYSLAFEPEIFEVSSFVAVSYCWLTDDPESQWLKTTAIYLTLSILYFGSWGWALLASSLGFNWSCSWVCSQLEVSFADLGWAVHISGAIHLSSTFLSFLIRPI